MKRTLRVEISSDVAAVGTRAAQLTDTLAREVIARQGCFTLALSGGSTPQAFHRALALMKDLEWSKIHIFYSDERAVPPDHVHSNHRMANEALLAQVPLPAANIHRIVADEGDVERAAKAYEREIRSIAADGALDLVMLGMGTDGHTASLFPGREPKGSGLVVAATAPAESPIERRVTFSLEALTRARTVMVLIAGRDKAERVAEILRSDPSDVPLRRVLDARRSDTIVLLDEAAASLLPKEK